jgi:hypothetical protein
MSTLHIIVWGIFALAAKTGFSTYKEPKEFQD